MIFYFSGTGNSQWVAEQLGTLTGDQVQDILKLNKAPSLSGETQVGFVFPVYAWGVAQPMLDFVKSLPKTNVFSFGVCTCGEEAGLAMKKLSALYPLGSSYSLVMPNNYIIGSDVHDTQTAIQKIHRAEEQLQQISQEILRRQKNYQVNEGAHPWLKSNMVNYGFNKFARTTKPFYATTACNSCGLCAKNCPASTITLVNGKPTWGKQCFQCLRCINQCPQKAIQYGKDTENRGRYTLQSVMESTKSKSGTASHRS